MSVASAGGHALKKSVLELGGSDPFIVLPSADLDACVRTAVTARVQNNGQSCIAAKRFIVVGDVADEFDRPLHRRHGRAGRGRPLRPRHRRRPHRQRGPARRAGRARWRRRGRQGATVHAGAKIPDGDGWWFAPTVLTGVTTGHGGGPARRSSARWPWCMRVPDLERRASRRPTRTTFGLGSSVWTDDDDEMRRCIEGIEAGAVFVNAMVASTPELPFGGIKRSGLRARALRARDSRSSPTPRRCAIA